MNQNGGLRLRKGIIVLLLLLLTASSAWANGKALQERAYFPPVLMYHDIKVKPINGFDVSVDDFQAQLAWLEQEGYQSLSMDEFLQYVDAKRPFPEKTVLITFDDGYEGVYQYAAPALAKHKMKATFFIFKKGLNSALTGYPYITDNQLRELAANPLFSIQSHTMTHADLSAISKQELQYELKASKQFIESVTNKPCRTIAFPFGHYNSEVLKTAKEVGYDVAFSVSDLGLQGQAAKYSIPRIYMGVSLGQNKMELFKKYLHTYKTMPSEAFKERFGDLPQ